jgi:hypothetical protein
VVLGTRDHHAVLARRQHLVGEDRDPVVARIHDADRRDVAEPLFLGRLLAPDLRRDVRRGDMSHRLGRESGLGHTDGVRGLPRHVDRCGDPHRIDVGVSQRLIRVPHVDEPLGVSESARRDHLGSEERWHDHGVAERELRAVGETDLTGDDLLHRDVEDPLDVRVLEKHPEHLLAARKPTDPEVPRERFGTDVGHRHLQLLFLEVVGHVERELVSRAEARGALSRSDDHRPRVVDEAGPPLGRIDGPVQARDRVGVASRAKAGDHVEMFR